MGVGALVLVLVVGLVHWLGFVDDGLGRGVVGLVSSVVGFVGGVVRLGKVEGLKTLVVVAVLVVLLTVVTGVVAGARVVRRRGRVVLRGVSAVVVAAGGGRAHFVGVQGHAVRCVLLGLLKLEHTTRSISCRQT